MKQIISNFICAFCVAIPLSIFGQELGKSVFNYDKYGNVRSVEFSALDKEGDYIKSADVFFRDVLKMKANDSFVRNKSIRLDGGNETFEQYYKGIKVENAGYTFHYDENGFMRYAHGNYVNVSDIDVRPAISKEDASKAFAKYIGIPLDSITRFSAELIIKSVKGGASVDIPLLVYKVSIKASNIGVTDYGYVDAKNGNVVKTESSINNIAATGTFHTKYYGTKYATTNYNNVNYLLNDPTRGNGIETKDLNNYNIYQINNATPLADYDNNWYYSDYADSTFMAFDVHWALQKIYDRLYNVHGKNSFDNNGKKIMAYVRALIPKSSGGYYSDDSCWNLTKEAMFFGEGDGYNRPFSALDVVAHEYGHAISQYQTGWTDDEDFLNEGLSDIWGAIMDYRFGDANTKVWRIGEHLHPIKNCIRDLGNPSSGNAEHPMTGTYNSTMYFFCDSLGDYYGMSGVFSHWFYLLVNGGSAYNENGTYYNLSPIGMDVAESLIVKAVYDNYLRYTTSYEDLREAFVWAARSMNISGLEAAVCNAWYAVGVGDMYLSLTGPVITSSQSIYTVDGLPDGFNVVWSLSDNYYYQNCLQQTSPTQCTITRSSSQDMISATLTATIKHNSDTIQELTKTRLYAYAGFKGTYTNGQTTKQINLPNPLWVLPGTVVHLFSPNLINSTETCSGDALPLTYWLRGESSIDIGMPSLNNKTLVLSVTCDNGDHYNVTIITTTNLNQLSINVSEGLINVSLIKESDEEELRGIVYTDEFKDTRDSNNTWLLEVFNALTGQKVFSQNVEGTSYDINTTGWKSGVYLIRVTIEDVVLSEKVVIE